MCLVFGIGIEFAGFKPKYVPRLEESINIYIESPFSCLLFQWRNYIEIYQYKAKCKGKVENLKYISNNSSQLGPGMGRKFLCSHRWNWIIQRNDEWMDGRWWLGDGALQWHTAYHLYILTTNQLHCIALLLCTKLSDSSLIKGQSW